MKKQYDEMFKKQCVALVIKEGRTISSIQREFDLGHGTLNSWIKKYSFPLVEYSLDQYFCFLITLIFKKIDNKIPYGICFDIIEVTA